MKAVIKLELESLSIIDILCFSFGLELDSTIFVLKLILVLFLMSDWNLKIEVEDYFYQGGELIVECQYLESTLGIFLVAFWYWEKREGVLFVEFLGSIGGNFGQADK